MTSLLAALVAVTLGAAAPAMKIPLVKDLVITSAVSERQGDYETQITVVSIDPDGSLHLAMAADLPGADGGPPIHLGCTRTVPAADLSTGGEFQYMFGSGGQEEYPGATTLGPSAAVFSDLVSKGEASIKLDGEVGGLAGLMGGVAQMMEGKKPEVYLTAEGILKLAEPKPEGHTDNIGGDSKNQQLSARRAASVKAALVERGVAAARLQTTGYGRAVPKATNDTIAGRARNRRVELSRP